MDDNQSPPDQKIVEAMQDARILALEQQLLEQKESTARLFEASREGLWDFELKPDGKTFIAPRTAELLGYPADKLPTPFIFSRHVHAADWPLVRTELEAALKGTKERLEADCRIITPAGEVNWVRIRGITAPQRSAAEIKAGIRPQRLLGSALDIGREHLAGVAALEADAGFHARGPDRCSDAVGVGEIQRDGLFNDEVLPGLSGRDDMVGVLMRITADRDGVEVGVGQHGREVGVGGDRTAVLGAQCGGVLRA